MKRISIVIAMTFALLVCAYSQTPKKVAQNSPTNAPAVGTPQMWQEYTTLVRANRGEVAIRAWARKHKVKIVSLKGYDIIVVPDQTETTIDPKVYATCDAKKCPQASGISVITVGGKEVAFRNLSCKAQSCKWIWDPILKKNIRLCDNWKCENGAIIYYPK